MTEFKVGHYYQDPEVKDVVQIISLKPFKIKIIKDDQDIWSTNVNDEVCLYSDYPLLGYNYQELKGYGTLLYEIMNG